MRISTLLPVLILAGGCGTLSIGRAPTDLDLQNDGTSEAQKALQHKYELTYQQGMIARPGSEKEVVAAEIGESVAEVKTPAYSDNATDYLSTSVPADEATDTVVVGFDRFAHSNVPTIAISSGCILVGAVLGLTSALSETQTSGNGVDDVAFANASQGALNGAFVGLFVGIPINFIYEMTVPLLSSSLASPDYRKGVRAFNKDLSARIKAAGKTNVAPPPAPTSTTPPSTPPPTPLTSSPPLAPPANTDGGG